MDLSEIRKVELPMQVREAPIGKVDKENRTVELVWTTGARVLRYDWWTGTRYWEELSLDPKHVRMGRLQSGAPLLAAHNQWDLNAVIGVTESAELRKGEGVATVRFAKDDESDKVFQKVQDKILRNVSNGYIVFRYEKTDPAPGSSEFPVWRAIDWEPCELSIVPVNADASAQVRSAIAPESLAKIRTFPCEFITPTAAAGGPTPTTRKESTMDDKSKQGGNPAADDKAGNLTPEQRAEVQKAERARIAEIQSRSAAAGLGEDFAKPFVDGGKTVDEFCRAVVDEIAKRKTPTAPLNPTRVTITDDERVKLRTVITSALTHRLDPRSELLPGAGDYRYMSVLRIAEEVLEREGVKVRGMSRIEIATRSLHAVGDFPNVLADVANKRLRAAYMENMPSYARWARRAPNAPDFKNINVTQISGAPDLQRVYEGAEFKRGAMTDGKEVYSIVTYGRIISYTRQAMINDDLGALDRTPRSLAAAGRRLENATVYGVLTANGTMSDTGALFNATAVTTAGGHANLGTGGGSALSTSSLPTGRTAMRLQKGKGNEPLNIAPAFLIVPATLEQTGYQLTSANYVPATPAAVNEFRAGGRTALEPIVESLLDASSTTAWYLAADPDQIDTIEYCYLDGNEGMSIESQLGFTIDGIDLKARLDFAAAAIDHRGLYKANGA